MSLKFVPKGPINNIPALVQIMAWRRPGVIDSTYSKHVIISYTVARRVGRSVSPTICSLYSFLLALSSASPENMSFTLNAKNSGKFTITVNSRTKGQKKCALA